MISICPVLGIGEICEGDDIGGLLADAIAPMQPESGDICVVTSKILSKSEGRVVALETISPSTKAQEIAAAIGKDARLVELILSESTDIIRAERGILITRHHLGLVMANAGIDSSNAGPGDGERVLLLPRDPDGAAQALSVTLQHRLGVSIGVIISDSFGRPWRQGVVNVAIGAAGIASLLDRRGDVDRDGRVLQSTVIAQADLIASAAGLAMGEAEEGVPAVLIRGLGMENTAQPASVLIRNVDEDLFR